MATSVASPLERHLGQIADVTEMTSTSSVGQARIIAAVRPRPRHQRRRARRAGGDQRRARRPADQRCAAIPTYRKVNPADAPILILALTSKTLTRGQIYDAASNVLQQRLSQVDGVGQVIIGGARAARGARRAQSAGAVQVRHRPGGRARRAGLGQCQQPEGRDRGRRPALPDLHQRPGDHGRRLPAADRRLSQRRARCGCRMWPTSRIRSRTCATSGCANGKPAVLVILFRQPGANIIDTVDAVKAALPQLQAAMPQRHRHQRSPIDRTHDDPRLAAATSRRTLMIAVDPGDAGGVPVPAQCARDADPARRRAGVAHRHVRRDVSAGLQPRQPVADGADRRHRLRGRRRHRGAGEHHPPHRGRHAARAGGAARARARSASPCSRSASR